MDKKNLKFFGIFIGIVLVLSLYFVLADSYNQAPSSAAEGTTNPMIIFNVSNDSSTGTTLNNITVSIIGNASGGNLTNVTLSNGTNTYYNDSGLDSVVIDVSSAIAAETNFTVNFILSSTAQYGLTLGANVTAIDAEENVSYSTLPYNSSLLTIADATAPTPTATCSPTEISIGADFPCSCSGTDSSYGSGVSTETGSSTSDSITDTNIAGTFTYTCTVRDVAGNSATNTAEYTVAGGGTPADVTLPPSKHLQVFPSVTITPGVATIMKDFDPEIGLKEIKIEVNNKAQNVQISVAKYDGKPALVSVEKTGKVYQYLEIVAQNLGSKLNKAIVKSKVEKSWVSDNGLDKEKIALFKFVNNEWIELTTLYKTEDSNYYYYDTELTSFSYFVIAESLLEVSEEEPTLAEQAKSLLWLWILIVLVLAVFVWIILIRKKRKK